MLNKACLATQTSTGLYLQGACRSSTASPSAQASCRSPTENTIPHPSTRLGRLGHKKGLTWHWEQGDFSARMIKMQ